MQSFWQQIKDLRFKNTAGEILFDKVLENQNINNITINLWKTLRLCLKLCEPLKRLKRNFYQNAITLRFSGQNYKLCY